MHIYRIPSFTITGSNIHFVYLVPHAYIPIISFKVFRTYGIHSHTITFISKIPDFIFSENNTVHIYTYTVQLTDSEVFYSPIFLGKREAYFASGLVILHLFNLINTNDNFQLLPVLRL